MTIINRVFGKNIDGKALSEQWVCLHTQTQREIAAEKMLRQISADYGLELYTYCPIIEVAGTYPKRVYNEKEKKYETTRVPRIQKLPLFPSYFFATVFPHAEYADTRSRGCKAAWVYFVGTIDPEYIVAIAERENSGVVRLSEDLPVGTTAHLTDGSMAGVRVTVQHILYAETPMQDRITILFSLLGREHTAEVSRAELRAA